MKSLRDYEINYLDSWIKRFLGLMFKELNENEVTIFRFDTLKRKRTFHTFFMKQNLDFIVLDQDFRVGMLEKDVAPNNLVRFNADKNFYTRWLNDFYIKYVIECNPGTINSLELELGDKLYL
ncbi:MAG: DUF192 domain-containing protein [Elusimicrobiota bacterium]